MKRWIIPMGNMKFLRAAAAGSALALVALWSTQAVAQQPPIKVGMTTDLTGGASAFARASVNGVQVAIDELNASGGVLGRKFELLVRDSQLKPDLGASHTRELITGEKVDVLIGPASSGPALAISAMAKQYKKVLMITNSNSPRLTMELLHPYIFSIVATGLMESRAMAEAYGAKHTRIALIGGDYESAHQGFKYFKERMAQINPQAEIVAELYPKLGEQDYSSYISRLIASKPDFVYSYLFGSDMVGFFKQVKPFGFFEKTTFSTMAFMDDIKALGPELPDGIIGQMRAPFFAIDTDRERKFTADYRAKFHDYPTDFAIMSYEGMQMLGLAIKTAGSVNSDAISKALETMSYDGLRGTIKIRAADHLGNVPVYIGTTASSKDYPFKTLKNVMIIPAEKVWPSMDELAASRQPK